MLYLRQDVNEIKQIITSRTITSNDKPANSALFLPTSNDENNKSLNKVNFSNVEDASSYHCLKEEAVGEMTMYELEKEAIEKYLRKFKNNRKKTAIDTKYF